MEEESRVRRFFAAMALFVYLGLLAYLLFFSSTYGRTIEMGYRYNLKPFLEIRRGLENIDKVGYRYVIINIAGNVAAFMPFGCLLPMVANRRVHTGTAFVNTFLLSLCAETIQLLSRTGAFDVDDLILNTVGGVLGYWCYVVLSRRRGKKG
jgi:glycopeptide antibiotics resistance protein